MSARLLRFAVLAASLWYFGAYLAVAILRLRFPFDLEWMEGAAVDHVARVLRSESLYVAPGIQFIPFDYPPLYFYVAAAVAKVIGIGYPALRLVSLASSLVCFACIYLIVKAETSQTFPAIVAAGLFAATFRVAGAWLDLARVDSLFLALFLLAILVLRRRPSIEWASAAGVLLGLSYLTKQTALAMAVPIVLSELWASPRRGMWLAGSLAAVAGLATAALHVATQGWFTFYVWGFPFKHAFVPSAWVTFWTRDMLGALPIAFTCAVLLVAAQIAQRRADTWFWPAVFIGMVGGAYRSRLQTGGYDNVLLPAYAITAIAGGFAIARALERVGTVHDWRGRFAESGVYAACLVQLALLAYDPRSQVPRPADRAAGEQLLRVIGAVPGEVLLTHHGFLPTVVGKRSHAHHMCVYDILKVGDEHSARLAEDFRSAIRRKAFGAVVLDDTSTYFFMPELEASYELQSRVFSEPNVFYPVTGGVITRPEYVYVPKARPGLPRATVQERVGEALRRR